MTRASTADNTTARLVPLFRFTPVCAGVPPPAVRGLHEATGVAVYVNESNSTAVYLRRAYYLRGSIYGARSNISHPQQYFSPAYPPRTAAQAVRSSTLGMSEPLARTCN